MEVVGLVLAVAVVMFVVERLRPGRLWDMLFGTFRNPRSWDARCGFGEAAEQRLGAMLRGVDVSKESA